MEFTPVITKSGRIIHHEAILCSKLWNYTIWENGKMLGRIIIISKDDYKPIVDEDEEILLDTVVFDEEDRKKGVAGELIDFITEKGNHQVLITQWLDNRRKNLMLKHGFKLRKGMFKKQPDLLIYKKEE